MTRDPRWSRRSAAIEKFTVDQAQSFLVSFLSHAKIVVISHTLCCVSERNAEVVNRVMHTSKISNVTFRGAGVVIY